MSWLPRLACLLLLTSLSLVPHTEAATYYLNPATGVNTNTGTAGNPWKDLKRVMQNSGSPIVVGGDTINIQPGSYTRSQFQAAGDYPFWTQAHTKGTAGAPIIIQADPSGSVTYDGEFDTFWASFYASAANAGFYVVIQNLNFINYNAAVVSVGGPGIGHHVAVQNCTFTNIRMNASGVLGTGGKTDSVIYKNNRIINNGNPTFGGDTTNPNSQHPFYLAEDSTHIVVEGNYIEKSSGYGVHIYGHSSALPINNIIIRGNTIVNDKFAGILANGSSAMGSLFIYNNTIYTEAVPFSEINGGNATSAIKINHPSYAGPIKILNNIGYGYFTDGAVWLGLGATGGTFLLDYNLWSNLTTPASVYFRENIPDHLTLAGYKAATDDEDNSLVTDPFFSNPAAGIRNFTLQPTSPALNAGTFLTTTSGTGSTSTSLVVGDAGFFHDGFGLIPGDTIQINGSTPATPVLVTAVNYTNNTLTLQSPRSWGNLAGVALAWQGTKPDMGALEAGTTPAPLPTPANLRLLTITP